MSKLLVRSPAAPAGDGRLIAISPESAGWQYVGFEVYRLARGGGIERSTEGRELCLVMLSGRGDVTGGGQTWRDVGSRRNVFSGTPDAVYIPPGSSVAIEATADCELAMCWAPATRGAEPALLPAADVRPFKRGSGRTERPAIRMGSC